MSYIGEETSEEGIRFQVITLLHPVVIEKFPKFQTEIQDAIRSGLLNVAVNRYKNIRAMGALGMLVR